MSNDSRRLLKVASPWFEGTETVHEQSWGEVQPSPEDVADVRARAEVLYMEQVDMFKAVQRKERRSDAYFQDSVMNKGTLGDRMVAMTIFIRESGFFSLPQLRTLLASTQKKGRREAELASAHLADLFTSGDLVPKDRLLVSLARRQIGGGVEVERHYKRIVVWYFEDQLKAIVGEFVKALEVGTRDEMAYHKDMCLKLAHRLLSSIPEREKDTLRIVINKAGDSKRNVASRVPYLLGMLVQEHPNMAHAVVAEVERFLYRPTCTEKGRYYLTIFLSQIGLHSNEDHELAKSLTEIYFSQLQKLLEHKTDELDLDEKRKRKRAKKQAKKQRMRQLAGTNSKKLQHTRATPSKLNSKQLTVLLTGISRAFPYLAPGAEAMFDKYMDTFFKVVYTASFNKACLALSLLLKIMVAQKNLQDRLYTSLYYMLLNPELRTSSKQALFLNVLYGALRRDKSVPRVRAFVKRILQSAVHDQANFVCSALIVVSELLRVHKDIADMVLEPEIYVVPAEKKPRHDGKEGAQDEQEEEEEEQVEGIEEKEKEKDEAIVVEPTEHANERAHQLAQLEALFGGAGGAMEEEPDIAIVPVSSIERSQVQAAVSGDAGMYNPLKENPLRANADNSCAWELLMLVQHAHPSVAIFARQILNLEPIKYDGDPLLDFSMASFVDRYAYRAAKTADRRAPAEHEMRFDKKRSAFSRSAPSVNTKEFAELPEDQVRPEERFMHMHRSRKMRSESKKREREAERGGEGDEGDEIDDDEFNNLMEEEDGSMFEDEDIDFDGIEGMDYDNDEDVMDDYDDDDELDLSGESDESDESDVDPAGELSDEFMWEDDGLTNAFGKADEAEEKREKDREKEQKWQRKREEKKSSKQKGGRGKQRR